MIATELSESWPQRLAGKIPEAVDVFCLVGIEPESGRYVGWGYYESTTEMPGWGAKCKGNVLVLASVRVPLRRRNEEGLKSALKEACTLLSNTIWKNGAVEYVRFRNKLAEDLAFWKAQQDAGKSMITIERIDGASFEQLLKGRRI